MQTSPSTPQQTTPQPTTPAPPIDIGIAADDRAAIVAGLSRLLADTSVLYLRTHGYHWNVTGPMFQTLHLMFETHYTELWTALDTIAERIRALGHPAPGDWPTLSALTSLDETDPSPPAALDMVRRLVEGHEAVIRTARSLLPLAGGVDDEVTTDLLVGRLQVHEQQAWMLRSLLA